MTHDEWEALYARVAAAMDGAIPEDTRCATVVLIASTDGMRIQVAGIDIRGAELMCRDAAGKLAQDTKAGAN